MEFDDSINIKHLLKFGVGISLICNFLVFSDDKFRAAGVDFRMLSLQLQGV